MACVLTEPDVGDPYRQLRNLLDHVLNQVKKKYKVKE